MADSLIVFGGGKIFRINPNTFDLTLLGGLGPGVGGFEGLAIDDDQRLFGLHGGNGVYRVNPWNPETLTSPYGLIAEWPADITTGGGVVGSTIFNQDLWVIRAPAGADAELWRLNAEDPSSRITPFGNQGTLPSGIGSNVRSIASDGTNFIVPQFGGDRLYRVNPNDPDDTTGVFGVQQNSSNLNVRLPIANTKGAAYANGYLYILGKDDSLYRCTILDDYRTSTLTTVENTSVGRYPQLRGRSNAMTFGDLPRQISWMTVGQVEEQIRDLKQNSIFTSKNADEKYTAVNFATTRLESIPFKDNYFSPRFVDGFLTNNLGDSSNEAMPDKLKWAFTLLSESLSEFGNQETLPAIAGTSLPIDDLGGEEVVLSSLMMGLPMAVQSLLFEFVDPIALRETYRPETAAGIELTIRSKAQTLEIT